MLTILFLGLIITSFETRMFNEKEQLSQKELYNKSESAFTILTNQFACKTDTNLVIAYSLNKTKIEEINKDELKKELGISDKKIMLIIDGEEKINEDLLKNVIVIDEELIVCDAQIEMQDLFCENQNCNLNKKRIVLKVSG